MEKNEISKFSLCRVSISQGGQSHKWISARRNKVLYTLLFLTCNRVSLTLSPYSSTAPRSPSLSGTASPRLAAQSPQFSLPETKVINNKLNILEFFNS